MYDERNFIRFSPEGREIFFKDEVLQQRVSAFADHERPELTLGGRFLGEGRFSCTRGLGEVVLKVSSWTSSRDYEERGKPITPENLLAQFNFLAELRDYLVHHDPTITTPRQYFVAKRRDGSYLLAQEWMKGWESFDRWSDKVYPAEPYDENIEVAYRGMNEKIRERIIATVGNTALFRGLSDLHLDRPGQPINGGNILVPVGALPSDELPLCIIDQPQVA